MKHTSRIVLGGQRGKIRGSNECVDLPDVTNSDRTAKWNRIPSAGTIVYVRILFRHWLHSHNSDHFFIISIHSLLPTDPWMTWRHLASPPVKSNTLINSFDRNGNRIKILIYVRIMIQFSYYITPMIFISLYLTARGLHAGERFN